MDVTRATATSMTGPARRLLALLAVLALLAACGQTPEGDEEAAVDGDGDGTPAEEDEERVVFGLSTDVDVLDPHLFKNDTAFIVSTALYGPLIQEAYEDDDGALEATGEFVPGIAELPEYSEDRLTATFRIREDAQFADGTPITSEDWYYTWDRIFNGPGYVTAVLDVIGIESIDSISTPDPQTLVIERSFDSPMFEPFMASPVVFGVMPKHTAEEHATEEDPWAAEWFTGNANPSGPYVIESITMREEIVLAPNENFANRDLVGNAGVVFKVIPTAESRIALLEGGAIDIAIDLPLRDVARLEDNDDVRIYNFPGRRFHYVGFNSSMPPFDDPALRSAIQKAIPYDELIDEVLFGYGQKIGSVVSVGMPGYEEVIAPEQDLEGAAEDLAASSYDGETLTLSLRQSQPLDQEAAVFIQDALRGIGVNVEIEVVPDVSFQEQVGQRGLPFFLMDWQSLGNDGFYQLKWVALSDSPVNYTGYANERVDEVIDLGVPEGDEEERERLLREAQELIAEDLPIVPLFQPDNIVATGADVRGVNNFYDPLRRPEFLHKTAD